MISRRTFSSRAALFVLGCALQVGARALPVKTPQDTPYIEMLPVLLFRKHLRPAAPAWTHPDWVEIKSYMVPVRGSALEDLKKRLIKVEPGQGEKDFDVQCYLVTKDGPELYWLR